MPQRLIKLYLLCFFVSILFTNTFSIISYINFLIQLKITWAWEKSRPRYFKVNVVSQNASHNSNQMKRFSFIIPNTYPQYLWLTYKEYNNMYTFSFIILNTCSQSLWLTYKEYNNMYTFSFIILNTCSGLFQK
jgi:hypothetical protein